MPNRYMLWGVYSGFDGVPEGMARVKVQVVPAQVGREIRLKVKYGQMLPRIKGCADMASWLNNLCPFIILVHDFSWRERWWPVLGVILKVAG
jgi:hypothetical protein